jgi:hypothetical protein
MSGSATIVSDVESAAVSGFFFHHESHHPVVLNRTLHQELRLVEMYLIQRATSNISAHGMLASLSTNISYAGRNILQNAIDFVFRYLQICIRWTARQSHQAGAVLWRALRIADLLPFAQPITFRIIKWCGIALATIIGVKIIVNIGYWGFHKLLETRKRRLEERKRRAAYLSELRTKLAAEAAAIEDARVRQAREDQAIKDKLKRDEEENLSQTKLERIM